MNSSKKISRQQFSKERLITEANQVMYGFFCKDIIKRKWKNICKYDRIFIKIFNYQIIIFYDIKIFLLDNFVHLDLLLQLLQVLQVL